MDARYCSLQQVGIICTQILQMRVDVNVRNSLVGYAFIGLFRFILVLLQLLLATAISSVKRHPCTKYSQQLYREYIKYMNKTN